MNCGSYIHFDNWRNAVFNLLKITYACPNEMEKLYELVINIDGLPLFNCPDYKMYPILILIKNIKSRPICAGIYCTMKSKNREMPPANVFLSRFLSELNTLTTDVDSGFILSRTLFVCDAPARSSLKCIRSHTGYSACERCKVPGQYVENRVCFLKMNWEERCSDEYIPPQRSNHQFDYTPLIYHTDIVNNFILDHMHLVCLGVMKRMMTWWKGVPR